MAAYIDEHRSRFKVGPICRVLSESLDCGFLAPRGYRMSRTRPVSRMRARHEALARDILRIHSDLFMAVYGCGKTHAQLVAQGRDPTEVGRDQVVNIMRGLGIRGVRRGKTPVTTRPAKGAGGRPDLVERKFEAKAPNRLHVADITYVRMANGSFGCTAFVTDVSARRIVGWACATTMGTEDAAGRRPADRPDPETVPEPVDASDHQRRAGPSLAAKRSRRRRQNPVHAPQSRDLGPRTLQLRHRVPGRLPGLRRDPGSPATCSTALVSDEHEPRDSVNSPTAFALNSGAHPAPFAMAPSSPIEPGEIRNKKTVHIRMILELGRGGVAGCG